MRHSTFQLNIEYLFNDILVQGQKLCSLKPLYGMLTVDLLDLDLHLPSFSKRLVPLKYTST